MSDLKVKEGYLPGVVTQCLELHIDYYSKHWNFGEPFERKVKREMTAFFDVYQKGRDLFISIIGEDGQVEGTIAIDGHDAKKKGAHLRWFITSPKTKGSGAGNLLMGKVVEFCKERGYPLIYLTTFKGLEPARHLYEKFGFLLVREEEEDQWEGGVIEQLYRLTL